MTFSTAKAQETLSTLPLKYKGPGGAAAILRDGELVAQYTWGYADIDQHIPMSPQIRMPICSITKQLLCMVMLSLQTNPTPTQTPGDLKSLMQEKLTEFLPESVTDLTVDDLTDMISYEKYFDTIYRDEQTGYKAMAEPRKHKDGTTSQYRCGLGLVDLHGTPSIGHGGALRGFRLHRRYAQNERVSAIVMFNHESDAEEAAHYVLKQILDLSEPPPTRHFDPAPEWFGTFLDHDTQLTTVVSPGKNKNEITLPPTLKLSSAIQASSPGARATIENDTLHVVCLEENRTIRARRVKPASSPPSTSGLTGTYRSDELDSTFRCDGEGSVLYSTFEGFLGHGPVHLMSYVGEDVWTLADQRGMDAPAPGDWTVVFRWRENREVDGLVIGCWLARRLEYRKV